MASTPSFVRLPRLLAGASLVAHGALGCTGEYLTRRSDVQAGGACGPEAGTCAADLCCSAAGTCGADALSCIAPDCQLTYGPACDGNGVPSGSDLSSLPRPHLGAVPYGLSISHCGLPGSSSPPTTPSGRPQIALTFDDGPYLYTAELLDELRLANVTATFFVAGANAHKGQIQNPPGENPDAGAAGLHLFGADKDAPSPPTPDYPALLRRMHAEGHQIASHSWSHQDLSAVTAEQRRAQIVRNEIAFVDVLGFFPTYFRPPYTRCPDDCLRELGELGYHVLNYDIDTRDWEGDYTAAEQTYSSIVDRHHTPPSTTDPPSWIALAHDIRPQTVREFTRYMVDGARKQGYDLVTVGECLGDARENWYRDARTGGKWGGRSASVKGGGGGGRRERAREQGRRA